MPPFEKLRKITKYARKIQTKDDNDLFIGVTGTKGSGKTSFSIQMARDYVEDYFGEKYFNVGRYVAYNNRQILEKLHTLPVYSPLIADEAIRIAWSREWNKADNKDLAKFSAQVRPKKHIVFMNIPKLAWIDSSYREGMLDMWVWVHSVIEDGQKKAYAVVFLPDENQAESDSWHLKMLKQQGKKIERVGRFTSMEKIHKIVKKHPCYLDMFMFPKVPKDIYDRYLELRTHHVMERESEFVNQKDMAKVITYNLYRRWKKFDDAVKKSRFGKPNQAILTDLTYDPTRKKNLVQKTTVYNWIKDVEERVPFEEREDADDTLEQEDKGEAGTGDDKGSEEKPSGSESISGSS